MASGFITLSDGTNWSARWSRYDLVLEAIMGELSEIGDEAILKKWINYILPNEEVGDIECGYCFYKKSEECILRIIDTRLMKDNYREIFWNKVIELSIKLPEDSDLGYLINSLLKSYESSLKNDPKIPDDVGLRKIFFFESVDIGN